MTQKTVKKSVGQTTQAAQPGLLSLQVPSRRRERVRKSDQRARNVRRRRNKERIRRKWLMIDAV